MDRQRDLARFYWLIARVQERCGGARTLASCGADSGWHERGVYFFFEPGEFRSDGRTSRVVHVGTHAVGPSKATLWDRLSQHQGYASGQFAGGGNHRGSIFRKHVGLALLAAGEWPQHIRETWGKETSASIAVRRTEHALECAVSKYLGAMPFVWVAVDDAPSKTSDRAVIKRGSVALLSNSHQSPIDPPSERWLGKHSVAEEIQQSGLWNVNHIDARYQPSFLDVFERWIA